MLDLARHWRFNDNVISVNIPETFKKLHKPSTHDANEPKPTGSKRHLS